MSIKMICCDMDGTLLTSKKVIDEVTRLKLIEAQKKGIMVVIASGRNKENLTFAYKSLHMDKFPNNYIVGINGQEIYSFKSDEYKLGRVLNSNDANRILESIHRHGLEGICFSKHCYYNYLSTFNKLVKIARCIVTKRKYNYGLEGEMSNIKTIKTHSYKFNHSVNKVVGVQPAFLMKLSFPKIVEELSSDYELLRVAPNWLEIMPKGVSKGLAIKRIALANNISSDEIVTFGDGENDISMFEFAKYGIAMENAMPTLKDIAYDVTESNDNSGIAKYLEKLGV
ncbi:MAG: Cof-type HAD-IIB family hydrolase [Erysipelotrichaceae bacterium]